MNYLKCYDTLGEELKYLYQWDINPNVIIKEIELDNDIEVHVCHVDSVNALTVIPSVTDGNIVVSVPSVLLQRAAPIMIYFVRKISEESACTIMVSKITVIPRARPSDYVYTESEVLTWRILDERLKKIEDGASVEISPEVVEKAITEYLDENPPAQGVPGKTPVKGIDYFTPEEVHDIAEQAAGLVEIPESGGIEVTGAEVGQTIVVKAVDENGKPTEWETADIVKKTKIITVADITAENDIVLSRSSDTDDLTFGDAVVGHNHYFYKTPEGKRFKAKRIYGYVYSPSAVTGTGSCLSPYYADGDPTSWMFGDFVGNSLGMGELCNNTWSIAANQYHVFEASADMIRFGFATIANLNWRITLNRNVTHKAIDHQFPHISGVKLAANMTLPAGTKFVIKAEVYDE